MISSLSKFVSLFLCKKKVVKQEELEVYQYGFEVIFSTIVGIMLTLIVGLLYHKIGLSLLYNAIFSLLRQKTGGYHAKTYLMCNFVFTIVSFATIGMTCLSACSANYSFSFHLLLLITATIIIAVYAPVENPNNPLDDNQKRNSHIGSVVSVLVVSVISCAVYEWAVEIAVLIAYTVLAVSMLMMVAKFQEGGEYNEK